MDKTYISKTEVEELRDRLAYLEEKGGVYLQAFDEERFRIRDLREILSDYLDFIT